MPAEKRLGLNGCLSGHARSLPSNWSEPRSGRTPVFTNRWALRLQRETSDSADV
ncbi:MAG: hypothetical protein AVDCRST_MAG10-1987 [uncultured Acidimicrobiales bacterium]|uniref:Uncharacterized protein n=1 Tax=uncultured Acidimicrobiales bacterium TaxID=310071 RepID=A0A6J4ICD4_9ACTN|nr:MAG: hypothetical protein AVDCRST_MAG10-1987 [uncultured Acidimicrobiales bacterium]